MCRMILGVKVNGRLSRDMAKVLGKMAKEGMRSKHGDGTGALFVKNGKEIVYKTLIRAWECAPHLGKIVEILDPEIAIIHARKASKGLKRESINLVHPMHFGKWYLFHNGTVRSVLEEVRPGEESDTYGIVKRLEERGFEEIISLLKKEGSPSNLFAYSLEEGLFVLHYCPLERGESDIAYYTLYFGEREGAIYISSERNELCDRDLGKNLEVLEREGKIRKLFSTEDMYLIQIKFGIKGEADPFLEKK